MGVADPLDAIPSGARDAIRARHGIPADALVIAAFGGVTPEKRIASILRAVADLGAKALLPHVLLVGEEAEHYDVRADAARAGISDRVHITGYVTDEELPSHLAAADVCACLRWPTNRETSASWLRCLAAGKATIITDLAQHVDLPEIALRIDVLEEEQALPQALERLLRDHLYRDELGRAARAYWETHHQLHHMADGYERALTIAASLPNPRVTLPPHITNDGSDVLRRIASDTDALSALGEVIS
jgi:glycosyltransferase involved in cell wall biosynthesis